MRIMVREGFYWKRFKGTWCIHGPFKQKPGLVHVRDKSGKVTLHAIGRMVGHDYFGAIYIKTY